MKPGIPQGTRDFNATIIKKRRFILDTIRSVFELYGFEPLETPSFENIETLMGKYGEEGDRLIFKILNNGLDNEAKREKATAAFDDILAGKTNRGITERALRYDLTIPFARFVAMNHGALVMPYKRYQMQNVWRADRPQKGRYREFFQCDADVVGTTSPFLEVEFANIYAAVFNKLKLPVQINVNSRSILSALAEGCGVENPGDITISIDKLDKIGLPRVLDELLGKGLSQEKISLIEKYLNVSGGVQQRIAALNKLLNAESSKKGIGDVATFFDYLGAENAENNNVVFDQALARGLDYYTGLIFEVKVPALSLGSIGGGGRYDNLTALFGVKGIPGSGISFGVDRIYDAMEELQLFPLDLSAGSAALFMNLGEVESKAAFAVMQQVRNAGVSAEIYFENVKLEKQFKYATKKNIHFAVLIGANEIKEQKAVLKDLRLGEQKEHPFAELAKVLSES